MAKSRYPETIYFCGQLMTSRISLKPDYKIERKNMRKKTALGMENAYISPEKQAPYILQRDENLQLFVDAFNKPLNGEFDFILTCEENPKILYGAMAKHSNLANGKKVLASGSLEFKNGVLVSVSNNSGHYRPTNDEMLPAIKGLYKLSNGNLTAYRGHGVEEVLEYSVDELLMVDTFDAIKSIKVHQVLGLDPGLAMQLGYEGIINCNIDDRYNSTLHREHKYNYTQFVENGYSIFSPMKERTEDENQAVFLGIY